MVGDTLLFWRIGLFVCKNNGNGYTHSGEREMEQFSLPHICTCLNPSSQLLAQKQLVTSPSSGSGKGSATLAMSPFPSPLLGPAADLAQPGAVGTSHPSLWCCWAVHCLFAQGAEGLPGTRVCSRPASLQSWGCCRMWHGGNEACLALGQKPGISSLCPAFMVRAS